MPAISERLLSKVLAKRGLLPDHCYAMEVKIAVGQPISLVIHRRITPAELPAFTAAMEELTQITGQTSLGASTMQTIRSATLPDRTDDDAPDSSLDD